MPSPHANLLDYHLGLMYQATHLNGPPASMVLRIFREALEADQELRRVAEQRAAGISDHLAKRDFISKRHRDFLRQALAMEPV